MKNKIVALGLAFATLTWAAPMIGQAATTEELQAQITALLVQIAALQAQLQTPSTATACFTLTLKFGSTGSEVTTLQTTLKGDATIYPEGLVTGYFGSLTRAAVERFQAKYSIVSSGTPETTGYGQVGPMTRAKLNALYCVVGATPTPTPTATPVVGPLTVTLASDNPAGANIQQGSANNTVAKFTFTTGPTVVNVTGLTLKSYGTIGATQNTEIPAIKLFDEYGIQLGNNRTQAGNQVNFVIVPALAIPANSSRTISVTVNVGIAGQSVVMSTVRYGIESAAAIVGATLGGVYPLVGNSFMVVPAGQLGSVSVGKFGTPSKTTVKIGEKDIVVEKFNVSAGSNEDITVNQIVLSSNAGSTIADSDISNIRIRKISDGSIVAGPLTLSNKKATFNLTTPIALVKGASVNLEVIADIANGNGRTIKLEIATGGVVASGNTSGTNIVSTGNTVGTSILIGIGTLTVSMSTNHPQGANALIIVTTNKKTLAAFNARANGEDIIMNTVNVTFADAVDPLTGANYVSAVGLYDGDSLISNLITVDDEGAQSFSLNYTVPANTTKEILVKGVTNTLTVTAWDTFTTTWSGYNGYGLSSGEIIASAAAVASTALTVYPSGKVTVAADTVKTPYTQGILSPINNVIIGALKLYAQREDMRLTDLTLQVQSAGAYTKDDISSLTLYADDGVTVLSDPVSEEAANNLFTWDSSEFLGNDIVFTKSAYKTILVKANANIGIDAVTGVFLRLRDAVADQLTLEGVDSATAYDINTDIAANIDFTFASPYAGGLFSFDKSLVEMKKASTSPSGSVSRGTLVTYAVWDVQNLSSDAVDLLISDITFTSKTGLPSTLTNGVDANDALLFELYDGDGNRLAFGADGTDVVTLLKANGTIQFQDLTNGLLTIQTGEIKQLVLRITTTSTTIWPSNTQMQWTVNAVGDVIVETGVVDGAAEGLVGYGGATWTIPATTNIITLP